MVAFANFPPLKCKSNGTNQNNALNTLFYPAFWCPCMCLCMGNYAHILLVVWVYVCVLVRSSSIHAVWSSSVWRVINKCLLCFPCLLFIFCFLLPYNRFLALNLFPRCASVLQWCWLCLPPEVFLRVWLIVHCGGACRVLKSSVLLFFCMLSVAIQNCYIRTHRLQGIWW